MSHVAPGAEPGGFSALDHRLHAGYLTEERADLDVAEVTALLGLDRPARILDAGCGDGRIALRLARLGHELVAVDRDPDQLDRARRAALASGIELELIEADLRVVSVDAPVDAALLWFTTFGFLDDEGNAALLASVAGCLKPGGALLIDTLDPVVVSEALEGEAEPAVIEEDGIRQSDRRHFDAATGRLEVTRRQEGPEGIVESQLSLRLPSAGEWRKILDRAGLELRAIESDDEDDWSLRVLAVRR